MILALLLAQAQAATCPADFPTLRPGWNRGLSVAGQERAVYALFPTKGVDPAPLFFAFNGTSEDGASFSRRARLQDFADRGFLVLAPSSNANGAYWPVWDGLRGQGHEGDDNPDLALFDTLLACISAQQAIDPNRVYAGGHSAGGIFTNHLIQRRSEVLAGVIVGSGIFSQTSPAPLTPLSPTTILLTWGGDNDQWSGRAGATAVKDISFPTEGGIAGLAYAKQPGVDVITCVGDERGHAWLDDLNGWMIDQLLARPRGAPIPADFHPPASAVRCVHGPVAPPAAPRLTCPPSATPGCTAACQQIADGAVTNRTVGPVLRRELRQLGFTATTCDACVARCEALATTPADATGLACLAARPKVDPSLGGISGAMPLIEAINTCCGPNDGPWCSTVCDALHGNLVARSYVPACTAQ